ncbi:MAG: aminodeoxychorismate lyase [Thiothrix sp.]|uniref:aminodeoxychorismate lyase n=1 Tax=Thiothrix sp. TaxID=1032 RepID=UPI0026335C5F|nr:aminodeoxychorismate lyase [Thiothrix sp.]MDD5392805.1 aminodeoxychorismate lyase [Thiothrix sp.]
MIWVNGIITDHLPVTDRGLLYGDGVWETLCINDCLPILLDWHLKRLQQGLQALSITPPDMTQFIMEIHAACTLKENGILKLIITRGRGVRGYNPQSAGECTRIIQLSDAATYPPGYATQGICLTLCETALAHQPRLAGFKHLNRLEQVLARAEFGADFQEGLVRDYAGNVIEGTMSNLFVVQADGSVCTPDLSQCGIAGVMRRFIIQTLAELGIECHIRPLKLEAIRTATALFMTNSLIGLWPVREFQGKTYNIPPLVQVLQTRVKTIT